MLEIGTIDSVHGLKGDVIVNLLSNMPERLDAGAELFLQRDPSQKASEKIVVKSSRKHKKKFIVLFEGVETREQADELRMSTLFAEPLEGDTNEDENLWLHEIVGSEVFDQHGKSHGKIKGLEVNPASDLLVLESGALVPAVFIESHTLSTSKDSGSISGLLKVNIPDGLLEE